MSQECPLTLSCWSLGDHCSFEERLAAAHSAGFEGIGLRAEVYVDTLNEGLDDADILSLLQKYQLQVTEIEYITQWAEEQRSYEQKYKEQICLHMCQLFGVQHINCGLMESYDLKYTAQKLRELCRRADPFIIALEPMPYSGLPDVHTAWEVMQQAHCSNAKLLLDSWHWLRAGQDYSPAILAAIPAEQIISIQINDILSHPYAKSILRDESMHDRLPPGEGVGNIAGFLQMLREKGVQPAVVGVEVISDALVALGIQTAAKKNFAAASKVLQQAWPELLP